MKFELGFTGPGRRNLIIAIIALVVIASITAIIIRYQSRSTYQFPPASTDTTAGTSTLTSAIALCTTNYRTAIAQGLSDSTPEPKSVCIQNAVDTYFGTKCPFVVSGSAPTTPPGAVSAYNQYAGIGAGINPVGGDAAAVTSSTQYINLVNSVPTGLTSAIVTRARKADLTGPTRKYIETACPDFYKPADSTGSDFTLVYKAWGVATGASAPTAAGQFGFYAPRVTAASVTTWASYAATPITVTSATVADTAATTTKTLTVTGNFPTALSNAKVKVTGITGVVLGTAAVSSSSITLTYPSQIVPIITAGTAINMSTASAISSVTFPGGGGAVLIPNTTNTPTSAITTVTLAIASALDASLVVGSQVLISGSTISGQVTISTISTDRLTIGLSFPSQVFPILPTGSTIESIIETPYATPLVSTSTAYNKIGTMAGQKMFNWQIAQVVGPGTYWNGPTAGSSAIVWGV